MTEVAGPGYQFQPQPEIITPEDLHFGWFIPTWGDTTAYGDPSAFIRPSSDYFLKVATAAEQAGFEYALVPVHEKCWEAWITCAHVVARTERLIALVAARPQFIAPTVTAKMISTFDQLTKGRIYINLIAGGDDAEMAADGDFHPHDERYGIMDETCHLMKRVWTEKEPVNHRGKYFHVERAKIEPRPYQQPYPPFYLGGLSAAAKEVSAKHVNVFLIWADTPEQVAQEIAEVRRVAAKSGRADQIRFGIRLQVVVRETEEEAWRFADGLIAQATEEMKANIRSTWNQSQAQARERELGAADGYRVGKHLWSGLTTVRVGVGVAAVGNPEQVAETIQDYVDLGCTEFCLSGYPHDEEAERFGRLVMPYFEKQPLKVSGVPVGR